MKNYRERLLVSCVCLEVHWVIKDTVTLIMFASASRKDTQIIIHYTFKVRKILRSVLEIIDSSTQFVRMYEQFDILTKVWMCLDWIFLHQYLLRSCYNQKLCLSSVSFDRLLFRHNIHL